MLPALLGLLILGLAISRWVLPGFAPVVDPALLVLVGIVVVSTILLRWSRKRQFKVSAIFMLVAYMACVAHVFTYPYYGTRDKAVAVLNLHVRRADDSTPIKDVHIEVDGHNHQSVQTDSEGNASLRIPLERVNHHSLLWSETTVRPSVWLQVSHKDFYSQHVSLEAAADAAGLSPLHLYVHSFQEIDIRHVFDLRSKQ